MERFLEIPCDPSQLSPLTLAFVGDCVFELFVREALVCRGNCPVKKLHGAAVERVCCSAQAAGMERLMPILTEKEKEIFLRGRNAHVGHVPKKDVYKRQAVYWPQPFIFRYLPFLIRQGILRLHCFPPENSLG